jgi:phosphate transport system permease protein
MTAVPAPQSTDLPPRTGRSEFVTRLIGLLPVAAVSAAVTAALFLPTRLSGKFGMFLVWFVIFMLGSYLVVRKREGSMAAGDAMTTVFLSAAAMLVLVALSLVLGFVVAKSVRYLRPGFFTQTLEGIDPDAPATQGGAAHAIAGTIVQVLIATLISLPFGVLTAVYLNEIGGRMAGTVRLIVDAMSGIPSIVAGLFIFSLWVVQGGQGFSGLAAGLALAVLMLPTIARTTEEMLRLVPGGLRESALALGAPEWRTALRIVLPTAKVGIVTAVILGIARVAGETAPLLMTAFGNDQLNIAQTVSEPQAALPLFAYQQFTSAQGEAVNRGWVAALVLILLVLILFILARVIGRSKAARP